MSVFASDTEAQAFYETWCDNCFQPDEALMRVADKGGGCPLRAMAVGGVTPEQWTRRRKAEMGNTYKCSEFAARPPVARRRTAPADTLPMFDDLEPAEAALVPVDGWPDYKAEARKGGVEHQ